MTPDRFLRPLRIAAALALAAGLLLTVHTLTGLPGLLDRHAKRCADLDAVAALEAAGRQQTAALQAWAQAGAPAPALADLFRRDLPGLAPRFQDLEPAASLPGWRVRRTAVTLDNLEFRRLDEVVRVAASNRPPWTLAECLLQGSERPGVAARMELVFETLDPAER